MKIGPCALIPDKRFAGNFLANSQEVGRCGEANLCEKITRKIGLNEI